MKIRELFEENIPTYTGNIKVPENWKDLSKLSEKYPGYTPGCKLIGNFDCRRTSLTSLKGAPSNVNGDFYCSYCASLASLEGAPSEVHAFFCGWCASLTSLEGAPSSVGGYFSCVNCVSLISLKGAPIDIDGYINLEGCTSLRKPILSVLKIKNLKEISIDNKQVADIVNKHLANDRDILACQEDLIDAGLQEYAKL